MLTQAFPVCAAAAAVVKMMGAEVEAWAAFASSFAAGGLPGWP